LLGRAQIEGGLVISAPVYVELMAHSRATTDMLQQFLGRTRVVTDFLLDEAVWQEAGSAYAAYASRKRRPGSGEPKRLLMDFVIGAHALLKADRLLTLDAARYKSAFPKLVTVP